MADTWPRFMWSMEASSWISLQVRVVVGVGCFFVFCLCFIDLVAFVLDEDVYAGPKEIQFEKE